MSPQRPALAGFVLFFETSDIQAVLGQCRRRNPNILFAATSYRHTFKYLHQPKGFQDLRDKRHWMPFKGPTLFYLTYPFWIAADTLQIGLHLLRLVIRTGRPIPSALFNHLYHTLPFVLFRKLGLIRDLTFVSGDWLADQSGTRRLWSSIGTRIIFPWMDRLACSGCDRILQITNVSKKAREKYWGKKITRDEEPYFPPLRPFFKTNTGARIRKNALFLGALRPDSGLDLFLLVLARLYREHGTRLKLAGPRNEAVEALLTRAREMGLEKAVLATGPFDRKHLLKISSDCFCGLNLSTEKENYARYTLPAKSMDYLQYGVPILTNNYIGEMARWVRQGNLGAVTALQKKSLEKTASRLFRNQETLRKNISNFLANYRGTDFGKFFPAI